MDGPGFDDLSKRVGNSLSRRRALWALGGVVGALLPSLPGTSVDAGKKKKKGERCGKRRCGANQFCCDDLSGTCCTKKRASCCNVGSGTGTCCAGPNQCGRRWGNDAGPQECCPPERQWVTTVGLVRCCPPGTTSMGTGITTNGGPCCSEAKKCGSDCCGSSQICDGGVCKCQPGVRQCGTSCCNATSVGCEGNRCLQECDLDEVWGCGN